MAVLRIQDILDEPQGTIDLERYFLAGDFVVGVGYGLQLVLWFLCTSCLWKQRSQGRHPGLLIFLAFLIATETIFAITQARTIQMMYIEHRDHEGGPWQYYLDVQDSAVVVMLHASLFVLTFLGDVLVLWRCWVVWRAFNARTAVLITGVPTLTLALSFVVGTIWIVVSSRQGHALSFGTAYYAISLVLNVLLTFLISLRLLIHRRTILAILPAAHARPYVSLAAIVIESAALHTAFALAFVISYGVNSPVNQVMVGFASAAQQVATYLIIYRVADGKAWSKATAAISMETSVQFAPRRWSRTQSTERSPSGRVAGHVIFQRERDAESQDPENGRSQGLPTISLSVLQTGSLGLGGDWEELEGKRL